MAYDGSEILSIATRQRESCPTWRVATGSRGGTVQVWEVDRLGIMTNIFSKQVKEMIAKTLAYNPSDGGLLVFTLANSAMCVHQYASYCHASDDFTQLTFTRRQWRDARGHRAQFMCHVSYLCPLVLALPDPNLAQGHCLLR